MDKDNPVLSGLFGWDEICGVYTAEGGEKFITIGNFTANGQTTNTRLKKSKTFAGASVVSAYYFIDNISVVAIDDESQCDCKADERRQETKFIYEVAPMSMEGMEPTQVAKFTSIYYGYGDSELSDNSKAHLQNVLKILLDNPGSKITVESHLDIDEAADPALGTLSNDRAEAIKLFLMTNGVNYTRILIEDKKDSMPVGSGTTDLDKAKSRRVTFTFSPRK